MTILGVSVDVGKDISSELIGRAMGLPMTLGCMRLIWQMHPMFYGVGYRHTSEDTLFMLVFYCLGGFINSFFIANGLNILV